MEVEPSGQQVGAHRLLDTDLYIASWPNFTATPESETPVLLTYAIDARVIEPEPGQSFKPADVFDIVVRVRSWKPDGTSAAKVMFSWIATAKKGFSIHL